MIKLMANDVPLSKLRAANFDEDENGESIPICVTLNGNPFASIAQETYCESSGFPRGRYGLGIKLKFSTSYCVKFVDSKICGHTRCNLACAKSAITYEAKKKGV